MKKFRRFASVLLAMIMALALAVPAFATENKNDGKITITNAKVGEEYTIYKLFELESYTPADPDTEGDTGAYAYKVTSTWEAFFRTGNGSKYVTVDDQGYVTWKDDTDNAAAKQLAVEAMAYAVENNIANEGKKTATSDVEGETTTSLEFSGLGLGYYLVDSSMGALCSLNTTDKEVEVTEKNTTPTMDKNILKDAGEWDADNLDNYERVDGIDANVGDTITFELVGTAIDMTGFTKYNFIFHDTLSSGLTFGEIKAVMVGSTVLGADKYVASAVTTNENGTHSFTVTIDLLNVGFPVNAGDKITVVYTATLNNGALTTDKESNTANLEYSRNPNKEDDTDTTPDKTIYVYDFDIVVDKFVGGNTDENGDPITTEKLPGAEFALYKMLNGTKMYYQVNDNGEVTWIAGTGDEVPENATKYITDENGVVSFKGLESGTYYLVETAAPAGYNKLAEDVEVKITINLNEDGTVVEKEDGSLDMSATVANNGQLVQTSSIANLTGTRLPSTGGIGTTIFYVVGGVLVVGAAILLVTKKRMSAK